MSRRAQIRMSEDEQWAFLHEQRIVVCATNGRDGWPHLMPLWYVVRDRDLWSWTYAASQKVRNLERDPRATLQVETGEEYAELRGVMLRTDATIHRELETVTALGQEIFRRYSGGQAAVRPDFIEAVRLQAPKRVALQFSPRSAATWDHRKPAGA